MFAKALDVDAVQTFVLVADLRSFTRAAEALNTTQAAVSLKLKRLEDRLGKRLIERTPRLVRLSAEGAAFLDAARDLVAVHGRALDAFATDQRRLILGISHHIVGPELPILLRRLNDHDRTLVVEVRVASHRDILKEFDTGAIDAALVLRHDENRRDGEVLLEEQFHWFAATDWDFRPGEPLRLATQAPPCSIRAMAVRALDETGIPWTEVFVGGGIATIGAAVSAGLAAAALVRRVAPAGAMDVGARLSLPPLPAYEAVLHSNVSDARSRAALRTFAAAFKATSVQ